MYEVLASVYDEALGERYLPAVRRELEDALGRHEPSGRRLLDLGCGSGLLACELAAEGWQVTGVDVSPAMLELARRRSQERGVEVEWVEADMRRYRTDERFDLVLSLYDSLNHLMTNADLMKVLRKVHGWLAPGGLFAFDVSNRLAFWNLWSDPDPFEAETSAGSVRIHTAFDKANRVGEARVEVVRDGRTFTENLRQRFFSDTEIEGLMQAEGLVVVERRDFRAFPEDEAFAGRIPGWEGQKGRPDRSTGVWKDHPDPTRMKTFWLCRRRDE